MKVDWRSTRGQVEVRVPIKRETSKVVDQNAMASSQSTTSEKPPETKEDKSSSEESDNDSDESVSSYCEWDRKPLESYYCKCCHIKTYSDNDDKYMEERILCWDCYDYVREAIRRNRVYP